MVPKQAASRTISVALMFVGVGVIGVLTATLLKKLLLGEKSKDKIAQRKRGTKVRLEMLKSHMARIVNVYVARAYTCPTPGERPGWVGGLALLSHEP